MTNASTALFQDPTSLISPDLDVRYGPIDKLSRFFLAAEVAAREKGVVLGFGTFDELLAVNRLNRGSWLPLVPSFDPTFSDLPPDRAICLFGRDAAGDVVATQAVRLFVWTDTNFFEEMRSGRLLYADPQKSKLPEETWSITATETKKLQGRLLFSGAGWYRPDYRKQGIVELLCRFARAYAHGIWFTDYVACLMSKGVVAGGLARKANYPNIAWDAFIKGSRLGDMHLSVPWMSSDHMLDDTENALLSLTKIDGQVDLGDGKQHRVAR